MSLEKENKAFKRETFLEGLNKDFEEFRKQGKLWNEELKEREVWDVALLDGLEVCFEEKQ